MGAARSRRAGQKVGSVVKNCTTAMPKPPASKVRCDFDLVIFRCKHPENPVDDKRTIPCVKHWKKGQVTKNNLRPVPKRSKRRFDRLFGVTAFSTDSGADPVQIELRGGPGYRCSHDHPQIAVYDQNARSWVLNKSGLTKVTLNAKSVPSGSLPSRVNLFALIRYHFFPKSRVRFYKVVVTACGGRNDGRPRFRQLVQVIGAFPADTYKIGISIPPLLKKTHATEIVRNYRNGFFRPGNDMTIRRTSERVTAGRKKEAIADEQRWRKSDGRLRRDRRVRTVTDRNSEQQTTLNRGRRVRPIRTASGDGRLDSVQSQIGETFYFERNGDKQPNTASIGALIKTLIQLGKVIQEVGNFIDEFQPQVGWKFSFEVELCKGSVDFEWGYKEWQDHSVYKYWKLTLHLTVISVKIEVTFGAQFRWRRWTLTGVVFGNVSTELELNLTKEADPDKRPGWSCPFNAKVQGELGVRLVLGEEWAKAEGKFVIGFPMEATCVCQPPEPFYIDWRIDYTGITTVLSGSTKWFGSFSKTWELTPPKKGWKSGTFFKSQKSLGAGRSR